MRRMGEEREFEADAHVFANTGYGRVVDGRERGEETGRRLAITVEDGCAIVIVRRVGCCLW